MQVVAMLDADTTGPISLGNRAECTVPTLAQLVLELTRSSSVVVTLPLPIDDPTRRWPDISVACRLLGWEPEIALRVGLSRTIAWVRANP